MRVEERYISIITACLDCIRKELDRQYWNRDQREMVSPFDNSGEEFQTDVFTVRAYDWSEEDNEQPNFEYKGLKVWWYKYCGRGMYATSDIELSIDYLADMIQECKQSIQIE